MKIKELVKYPTASIALKRIDLDFVNNIDCFNDEFLSKLGNLKGCIIKINATILERDIHKVNFADISDKLTKHGAEVYPIIPKVIKDPIKSSSRIKSKIP